MTCWKASRSECGHSPPTRKLSVASPHDAMCNHEKRPKGSGYIDVLVPPVRPRNPAASFVGIWHPAMSRTIQCTSRLAPAERLHCMNYTHQSLPTRSARHMRRAKSKPPVFGFSGSPLRFSGSPLPQLHGSRVFRAAPNSLSGRAVAARCTVCRPHGKVAMHDMT